MKHKLVPYPGLLQHLPIPSQPWSEISMDFVEGLPKFDGHNISLVFVGRLTKYDCFMSLVHLYSVEIDCGYIIFQPYTQASRPTINNTF